MMTVRENTQKIERETLSAYAVLSENSKGRNRWEDPCPIRTCFQRDRDRIIHSKAFRRLKHKTQVFISPEGDHYRTRLTHTLEVAQISRTIARALMLNEDLAEAAALGHDLGHTPFGHAGESALSEVCPLGFLHNVQSLRVVDRIEKNGLGLNLSYEVRDGILCHTGNEKAKTLEGRIVHLADRIAYINHDIDDAVRAGVLKSEDLPADIIDVLGKSHSQRINTLVCDIINESRNKNEILQSSEIAASMSSLRYFLFERLYRNPVAKGEEKKGREIIKSLYQYLEKNTSELPGDYLLLAEKDGLKRAVCDYISGMTDTYVIKKFTQLFIPRGWNVF